MKKNILIFILLVHFSFDALSQVGNVGSDTETMASFLKSKVSVVLSKNDEKYNENLKKAVEDHWKVTPYRFITYKQFLETFKLSTEYFLVPLMTIMGEQSNQDFSLPLDSNVHNDRAFESLSLLQGGFVKRGFKDVKRTSVFAYAPYDYWGLERDYKASAYRLDL